MTAVPDSSLPWENLGVHRAKARKRVGMVVDPRRCVGCHACAVACKTEHEVQLGGFRIRTHYLDRPDRPVHGFLPMLCMHCADAPCIPACPNDAIARSGDGRVVISKNDCEMDTGCVGACPYGAIHIDRQQQKADKCDFCVSRTSMRSPGGTSPPSLPVTSQPSGSSNGSRSRSSAPTADGIAAAPSMAAPS